MATEDQDQERGELVGTPRPRVPKPKSLQSPPKAMLTVVEMVHFQSPDHEARTVTSRFNREVKSDEQPYVRKLMVTPDWRPLDLGWFADNLLAIGVIFLKSEDGTFHGGQPTDEQRRDEARKFVEVGILPPARIEPVRDMHSPPKLPDPLPTVIAIFSPGESQRLCLPSVQLLRIRCGEGVAKVTLTIFPL